MGLGVRIDSLSGVFFWYCCGFDVNRFYWCIPMGGGCLEKDALSFFVAVEGRDLVEGCPLDDQTANVLGGAAKVAGGRECYAGCNSGWPRGRQDGFRGDWNYHCRRRWAAVVQGRSSGCNALRVADLLVFLFLFLFLFLFVLGLRFRRRWRDRLCLFIYPRWSPLGDSPLMLY